MREPLATQVELTPSGEILVYRYSAERREIEVRAAGRLDPAKAERVFAQFADADAEHVAFSGSGVEQGDQFHLRLARRDRPALERSGFVHLADDDVRAAVDELLALGRGLTTAPSASAWLRTETIEPKRLAKMRAAQKVRFLSISELPAQLGPTVKRALATPRAFVALDKDQELVLPKLVELGPELFVLEGDAGYQLTLYTEKTSGESR